MNKDDWTGAWYYASGVGTMAYQQFGVLRGIGLGLVYGGAMVCVMTVGNWLRRRYFA